MWKDRTASRAGRSLGRIVEILLLVAVLSASRVRAQEHDAPADARASHPEPSSWPDPGPRPGTNPQTADAAPPETTEKPYWRRNLFGRFTSDQKYLFKTWFPSEFRRPGFALPIALGTAFALASSGGRSAEHPDMSLERDFHSDLHGRSLEAARAFTTIGDAPIGAVLIGTAYLVGRWSGHDRFAETASLSAQAVLDSGLWVTIVKGVTARTRPSGGGTGNFLQYNPPSDEAIGSFPSGHTTCAFAAATVFAGMYSDHKWVPWLAYGTASLVGASRVALGRHFPSDVFVGAFIGNSFGRMVLSRRPEAGTATSTVQPSYDPARKAAVVAWTRDW